MARRKTADQGDETVDLTERILRIELEEEMILKAGTGEVRHVNGLRIYYRDQTPSGRDKWVPYLSGPIISLGHGDGTRNDEPSYADLLSAAARIIEQTKGLGGW